MRTRDESQVEFLDLDGIESILDPISAAVAPPSIANLVCLGYRVNHLTVCRESNEFDKVLMEGMVGQTLSYQRDRASYEMARELGIRMLATPHPDSLEVTDADGRTTMVHFARLRHGRAHAVLFETKGDWFLYSMTSAAKQNAAGENDWTLLLTGVLAALQPKRVLVASISRLVRSFQHSGLVHHTVSKHVDEVQAGHQVLRMRGPGSETDQLQWSFFVMVAASERNLIVQRLIAGVVSKYRRGQWVKGQGAVPLGYYLDPESKVLRVNPEETELVTTAWMLMNSAEPARRIVARLGAMGVSSPTLRKRYGANATVADHSDPGSFVRRMLGWSHLYLTGQHTTAYPNPFEGIDHLAGMPVSRDAQGREWLRFSYEPGRPDVDPALIEGALRRYRDRSRGVLVGAAAQGRVAALNQVGWTQNGLEYWLVADNSDQYKLRVRNAGDAA